MRGNVTGQQQGRAIGHAGNSGPVGTAVCRVFPNAIGVIHRRDGNTCHSHTIDIGAVSGNDRNSRACVRRDRNIFGNGGQRGIVSGGSIVKGCQNNLHLHRCRRGHITVECFHGKSINGAIGVGGRREPHLVARGDFRGSSGDGNPCAGCGVVFGKSSG